MWVGDAVRLDRYWTQHPPLHVMVAAYLGVGGPTRISDDEFGAMTGARVITPDTHPNVVTQDASIAIKKE